MSKKLIPMLVISMLFVATVAVWAGEYQIDVAHTRVEFSIRHMVINNVKGVFKTFEGTVKYDPENPESFEINGAIKVKTIDTGIEDRDKHLLNEDFFDAAKYPEITFKSEKVEKEGSILQVSGSFTMHGVTKQITLPIKIVGPIKDPWGKTRIGLETSKTVNRKDYGMNWSTLLDNGGLVVGNEVRIEINAEAVLQE